MLAVTAALSQSPRPGDWGTSGVPSSLGLPGKLVSSPEQEGFWTAVRSSWAPGLLLVSFEVRGIVMPTSVGVPKPTGSREGLVVHSKVSPVDSC